MGRKKQTMKIREEKSKIKILLSSGAEHSSASPLMGRKDHKNEYYACC